MEAFPLSPGFTLGSFERIALKIPCVRVPGPRLRNRKYELSYSLDNVTEKSLGLSGYLESWAD